MRRWVLSALVLGTVCFTSSAGAEPRFTARFRQDCTLCHENPDGGGLRSLYASQFLVPTHLTMVHLSPEKLARIHPDVSPSVTVGTDIRTIWFGAPDTQPTHNFFQMEGAFYLEFAIDERISAHLDVDQSGSTEIFALGWVLPVNGWVKAGRFIPAFGWKFTDHKMFNRFYLGFDQPYNTDAGLEFGIRPPHTIVRFAVLNGEPGTNTLYDRNRDVAWLGDVLYQLRLGSVGAGLGGSIYYNRNEPTGITGGRRTKGGTYGYFNWRRWSWLWEVDGTSLIVTGSPSPSELITSHELSMQVGNGIDVYAVYDYLDPRLNHDTGTESRYGLGAEVRPYPFVGLEGAVYSYRFKTGPDVGGTNYTSGQVTVHLFY